MVQRNAAIVSSIPGTTRDVVELSVNISGYPIVLADTAGLNKYSNDVVEVEGIRRARDKASMSDFVILVISAIEFVDSGKSFDEYLDSYIKNLDLQDLLMVNGKLSSYCAIVVNKIDLLDDERRQDLKKLRNVIAISCHKEEGFDGLLENLEESFKKM